MEAVKNNYENILNETQWICNAVYNPMPGLFKNGRKVKIGFYANKILIKWADESGFIYDYNKVYNSVDEAAYYLKNHSAIYPRLSKMSNFVK